MSGYLPVLIVGAGPTGLMMACELARQGVSFRIIDKNPEQTLSSNATWIQTCTIEIFDHIGIVDRFLKIGHPCDGIHLYIDGKSLVTIPLNNIDSIYPFVLMLAQSETERLLIDRLEEFNKRIERSLELIDVKQDNNAVIATIKHADGNTEIITSDWLIACDGANSTVREKCHIFFPGENLTEQFIVADAKIDSYMANNEIHVFFDHGAIFAASPLGPNNYRITANLHLDYPRKIFTEREVIEMAQERAYGAYYVNKASWISSFWIHSKLVKHMRHDSIFLAGDAAHIHSPAGGQGMNTGLQDTYNLAWKLALVIKGKAKPALLNSYQLERYPVVNNIVDQTERLTKMALFDKAFLSKLRKFSSKFLHNEAVLSKKIGTQITQLDIRYKESPAISYDESTSAKSPRQGEHAPDVIIDSSKRLYDYLRNMLHNILLFTGPGPSAKKNELDKLKQLQKLLNQIYSQQIKIYIITNEELKDMDNVILDVNNSIHDRYNIKHPSIYIIRPDGYIAYYSKNFNHTLIEDFLKRYLY